MGGLNLWILPESCSAGQFSTVRPRLSAVEGEEWVDDDIKRLTNRKRVASEYPVEDRDLIGLLARCKSFCSGCGLLFFKSERMCI